MRERLVTLACALGALFLFGTLFWHGDATSARRVSLPTTLEGADNGLLGCLTWLRGEGVRTLSLRERFGVLRQRAELAPTGNLLIVTLPAVTHFRNDEAVALDQWIRNGNTLLVLAALADRPAWAQYPAVMESDLQLLTGLEFSHASERSGEHKDAATGRPDAKAGARSKQDEAMTRIIRLTEQLAEPKRSTLVPNHGHRFFEGVGRAVAFSDYAPREADLVVPRDGFVLALAHESASGKGAFWLRPDGAGTIIVSGFATLFTNRALGVADNARLLANLVAATLGPEGTVVFDDEHQGLTAAYDPAKFFRDPRLYATIATIAIVWLTWVLGGTRLRMPALRTGAPREAELVRTTGLFLARVLRPAAAARRMFEHFFRHLHVAVDRAGADEARLWDRLENHPRLARADVEQLRQWYAAARADQHVPLTRLHNLLVLTERQLAA